MIGAVFGGKLSIEEGMALRKAMVASGKKFIRLKLIDMTVRRMQAIQKVIPVKGSDSNGLTTYTFRETSGVLEFQPSDDNTEMIADILDSEFNRKFLASHNGYNFWHIEDDQVRKEVEAMADRMAAEVVKRAKVRRPREEVMSDEQLQYEMNKLVAQQAQRSLKRAENATVRPPEPKPETPEEPPEEPPPPEEPIKKPIKKMGRKPGKMIHVLENEAADSGT